MVDLYLGAFLADDAQVLDAQRGKHAAAAGRRRGRHAVAAAVAGAATAGAHARPRQALPAVGACA